MVPSKAKCVQVKYFDTLLTNFGLKITLLQGLNSRFIQVLKSISSSCLEFRVHHSTHKSGRCACRSGVVRDR